MKSITLRAHFDGKRICPDEPLNIAPNTELMVTLVPITDGGDEERNEWSMLSQSNLANAYSEKDADYPLSSVKRPNPEYDGR